MVAVGVSYKSEVVAAAAAKTKRAHSVSSRSRPCLLPPPDAGLPTSRGGSGLPPGLRFICPLGYSKTTSQVPKRRMSGLRPKAPPLQRWRLALAVVPAKLVHRLRRFEGTRAIEAAFHQMHDDAPNEVSALGPRQGYSSSGSGASKRGAACCILT